MLNTFDSCKCFIGEVVNGLSDAKEIVAGVSSQRKTIGVAALLALSGCFNKDETGLTDTGSGNIDTAKPDCEYITQYKDHDGDGFGDALNLIESCSIEDGYVLNSTDCDDTDFGINPNAEEECDGVDNDCDGLIDDASAVDQNIFYMDADGDGYGDASDSVVLCDQPSSYVVDSTDCDDNDANVSPGENESCWDSLDNNCDGLVDEDCDPYSLGNAEAVFYGEYESNFASSALTSAGDFNGDGYSDLAIGAHGEGFYLEGERAGATYIVYGPVSGEMSLADAGVKLSGERSVDWSGTSINLIGDNDDDGFSELVIGAPFNDNGEGAENGAIYIAAGPISGLVSLADVHKVRGVSNTNIGYSVVSGFDYNLDGLNDIVAGGCYSSSSSGCVSLILAPFDVVDSFDDAYFTFYGEIGSGVGYSLGNAGDVNADGSANIIVGAYGLDAEGGNAPGGAYILGSDLQGYVDSTSVLAMLNFTGSTNEAAGVSVGGDFDVNNDGYMDVILGAPHSGRGGDYSGAAFLVHGPLIGSVELDSADTIFVGERTYNYAGYSAISPGDVDNDGSVDILIGAPFAGEVGEEAGRAYLFFDVPEGTVDLSEAPTVFEGESINDRAGYNMANIGDINADNYADMFIGAYTESTMGSQAGAAYVVFGNGVN